MFKMEYEFITSAVHFLISSRHLEVTNKKRWAEPDHCQVSDQISNMSDIKAQGV